MRALVSRLAVNALEVFRECRKLFSSFQPRVHFYQPQSGSRSQRRHSVPLWKANTVQSKKGQSPASRHPFSGTDLWWMDYESALCSWSHFTWALLLTICAWPLKAMLSMCVYARMTVWSSESLAKNKLHHSHSPSRIYSLRIVNCDSQRLGLHFAGFFFPPEWALLSCHC